MTQAIDLWLMRVVEAMPGAMVLYDKAGQIRMINRHAECMFGYGHSELDETPVELLLPGMPRVRPVDLRQDVSAEQSSRVIGHGQTLPGLRKDGHAIPVEISIGWIDVNDEMMALTSIIDLQPRQKIDQETSHHRHDLQRSNDDLEEFAYVACHDLKAPLRAIGHLADWIRADIQAIATVEVLDNLTLLQGRAARLQMLLDGLLAYSRVGRTDSRTEDVDIAEVVRDVAAMLDLPPTFEIVCEGEMSLIRTHRMPIKMVFKNLISNGLQHHDQPKGRITVSMRLLDDMVEFRIGDDGPGIAKRFHDRIFLIFQTLQSPDQSESGGLGLAIVKKQVKSNGGRIWVESDPPLRGTTFVFTWKITPPRSIAIR